MHKISVIIPTYNACKYISQCLENVLNQTYKHLEIIVVNDGSTDNTAEIAKRYPVLLINQPNQGVSVARNTGLEAATGEYLHFMDVDDILSIDFYEKMLESITLVDADMACCNVFHERLPALTTNFSKQLLVTLLEDKLSVSNVYNQGAIYKYIFKTSLIKENNLQFKPELINAQDKVFSLHAIFYSSKLIISPEAVYYYKHRANSNMTSRTKADIKKRKGYIELANKYCKEFAESNNFRLEINNQIQISNIDLFGLPILKVKKYQTGRKKWKLLGITVLHQKV